MKLAKVFARLFGVQLFLLAINPSATTEHRVRKFGINLDVSVSAVALPRAALQDEFLRQRASSLETVSEQIQEPRRLRHLPVTRISRSDPNVQMFLVSHLIKQPENTVASQSVDLPSLRSEQADHVTVEKFKARLPPHLRQRADQMRNLRQVLNQNYSEADLNEAVTKAAQENPLPSHFTNYSPQPSLESPQVDGKDSWRRQVASAPKSTPKAGAPESEDFEKDRDSLVFADTMMFASENPIASRASRSLIESTPNEILGRIEFDNGLAVWSSAQNLRVFHEIKKVRVAEGRVNFKQGQFRILSRHPAQGEIVGELRDEKGFLMGQGIASVESFERESRLLMYPVHQGLWGRVQSTDSNPSTIARASLALVGAREFTESDRFGSYKFESLMPGSSAIVKSRQSEYSSTIQIATANGEVPITQLSKQDAKTLLNSALSSVDNVDLSVAAKYGMIWGRVTHEGNFVRDVSVSLVSNSAYGPIYFDSNRKPDSNLTATGANGLFAFVMVEPGVHEIRASKKAIDLPAKVVVSERGFVTMTEFELGKKKSATIATYNALSGELVDSRVNFLGSSRIAVTRAGKVRIKYSQSSEPLFIDVDAGSNYPSCRSTFHRTGEEINIPIIPQAWLTGIASSRRMSQDPEFGTIVGFVQGGEFRIDIDKTIPGETDVVYFDGYGYEVDPAKRPASGFVIFNVPSGLRSIFVKPIPFHEKAFSQIAIVDPSVVNVMSVSFE